ncbi:predicted protein [Chaetoceros tenuissimus]|uniref:Uncharacterized protein n=1 Tax=Chaetoceros tenuissimus TaxID=426638 RepID=A0AAD3CFH2_9STRA|nr:predicted protein [Chaetoceros tenuissimus]
MGKNKLIKAAAARDEAKSLAAKAQRRSKRQKIPKTRASEETEKTTVAAKHTVGTANSSKRGKKGGAEDSKKSKVISKATKKAEVKKAAVSKKHEQKEAAPKSVAKVTSSAKEKADPKKSTKGNSTPVPVSKDSKELKESTSTKSVTATEEAFKGMPKLVPIETKVTGKDTVAPKQSITKESSTEELETAAKSSTETVDSASQNAIDETPIPDLPAIPSELTHPIPPEQLRYLVQTYAGGQEKAKWFCTPSLPLNDVRLSTKYEHNAVQTKSRTRCILCLSFMGAAKAFKSTVHCSTCNISLCRNKKRNCFERFHNTVDLLKELPIQDHYVPAKTPKKKTLTARTLDIKEIIEKEQALQKGKEGEHATSSNVLLRKFASPPRQAAAEILAAAKQMKLAAAKQIPTTAKATPHTDKNTTENVKESNTPAKKISNEKITDASAALSPLSDSVARTLALAKAALKEQKANQKRTATDSQKEENESSKRKKTK